MTDIPADAAGDGRPYTVSVSGRTYFNIVLPALEDLELPTPLIVRAGRGARARFAELTYEQANGLAEFCRITGQSWSDQGHTAATSILARVFVKDSVRVKEQIEEQGRVAG